MADDKRIQPLCLIVPGLDNSGPEHWQTLWQARRSDCRRVDFQCWSDPDPAIWTSRLDVTVRAASAPIILIAHSLGCLTIALWASRAEKRLVDRIGGALLVAPPDVDRPDVHPLVGRFAPAPRTPLPFPSLFVASRNDEYAHFDQLQRLAADWGSEFVDVGACGHINAKSGIGAWVEGEVLLERVIANARSPAVI